MATSSKSTTKKQTATTKKTGTATRGRMPKEKEPEKEVSTAAAEIEALKAQLAEARAQVEAAKKAESETETLKKQVQELIARQDAMQRPQVIQVAADAPKVQFVWMAPVADDNVTHFGEGGVYAKITGKTGVFSVPKPDLSRLLTTAVQYYLDERWLIVTSGLDDEERDALGVNYKDGEILDRKAFMRLVEMEGEIVPLYADLCDGHKEMVAKAYHEAYAEGSEHVKREVVVELSKMAKAAGRGEDFKDIIERMNAADAE